MFICFCLVLWLTQAIDNVIYRVILTIYRWEARMNEEKTISYQVYLQRVSDAKKAVAKAVLNKIQGKLRSLDYLLMTVQTIGLAAFAVVLIAKCLDQNIVNFVIITLMAVGGFAGVISWFVMILDMTPLLHKDGYLWFSARGIVGAVCLAFAATGVSSLL